MNCIEIRITPYRSSDDNDFKFIHEKLVDAFTDAIHKRYLSK